MNYLLKISLLLSYVLLFHSCTAQTSKNMHKHTNKLITSTSPYLLQHAHNPVNWEEWGDEALNRAKQEDKPILVSIGYSSCHWCHVMEKESFEKEDVAQLMNEYFVCIKVDREERPDVDHLYMDALHAMGLNGGWPLNVFLTPDQKPFYGGTYFPKNGWMNLLASIAEAFVKQRDKINESAEGFANSLMTDVKQKYTLVGEKSSFSAAEADQMYQKIAEEFDTKWGGRKRSPKFPMPCVWEMLATYAQLSQNEKALEHLFFTLDKIADGGIYDHVGGGFARYSTDEEWHVPHFEKMLYDNGQLLSLYANAYKLSKSPKYKQVLLETTQWLEREMLDASGGFYSALDADSEGEEGKFYVWSQEEIKKLAKDNYPLIADYYDVSSFGNWEGKNVLRVVKDEKQLQTKYGLSNEKFQEIIQSFKKEALVERAKRIRPGLDNKIIAGWNGLTLSGLCLAYQATGEDYFLQLARKNATFIKQKLIENGQLKRFPNKKMEGFIEDYAAVIQSFIRFYETTQETTYLQLAKTLIDRTNEHFYDAKEQLYYFSSTENASLIAQKKELFDNVIPSSNSMMAWNLVHLGKHLYDEKLVEQGKNILTPVTELAIKEPEYMANWVNLGLELSIPFAEIVIVGEDASNFAQEINQQFIPNKIISATTKATDDLPIFKYKSAINEETTLYICYNKTCKRPTNDVKKALDEVKKNYE